MFAWNFIKQNVCACGRFKKCFSPSDKACFTDKKIQKQIDTKYDYLKDIEYKDTIGFVPPILVGKVIKVYDGDTITIASKLSNKDKIIYRFSVRLIGIDAAEIKGKTTNEKRIAIESRDKLHELVFDKMVHLKNISTEKYGRILADVYLDDLYVNKWMLDNGLAVPYDGGTKNRPIEWDTH
jgi:endonuclease YncB( thermonuclease family)